MIKEEKTRIWKKYVSELDMTKKPGDVWKTIRSLDGKNPPSKKNEVLTIGKDAYITDLDKANEFTKTYKSFSILPVCKSDRKLRRTVRKNFKNNRRPEIPDPSEDKIRMHELERALKATDSNKAAGEDQIPYEFLTHLGPKAKKMLLTLYNKCWYDNQEFPRTWQSAILKPLLKNGKDAKLTTSYRPISLTSCVGKILEKIVATRLSYIMEQRGLLNDAQAGFRESRSTSDQILRLTQSATDQIHQR